MADQGGWWQHTCLIPDRSVQRKGARELMQTLSTPYSLCPGELEWWIWLVIWGDLTGHVLLSSVLFVGGNGDPRVNRRSPLSSHGCHDYTSHSLQVLGTVIRHLWLSHQARYFNSALIGNQGDFFGPQCFLSFVLRLTKTQAERRLLFIGLLNHP